MKKLFITMMLLAFVGIATAQDVYTSGCFNKEGKTFFAIFKNGEPLYYNQASAPDLRVNLFGSTDFLFDNQGNVYWSCILNNSLTDAKVFKNDEEMLQISGFITSLCTDETGHLYSGGSFIPEDHSLNRPVVWKDDSSIPYICFDTGIDSINSGIVNDVVIEDGHLYACGYPIYVNIWGEHGFIWAEDGSILYDLGEYNWPRRMAFYDGHFYTVVQCYDDNNIIKGIKVFCDDTELYTLLEGYVYDVSICIDAGDIYVSGKDKDERVFVWKNGTLLYDFNKTYYYYAAVAANCAGIFTASTTYDRTGCVWINDWPFFYTEDIAFFQRIYVDYDHCNDPAPRTLPFYDSFENGQTDWTCWTKTDLDNDNHGYASYWDRSGTNGDILPVTGQHCIRHKFNSDSQQKGELVSPCIAIPNVGSNTTLTFQTREQVPDNFGYEGVWMSIDNMENWQELWTQANPKDQWTTVSIDLSEYQGYDISFKFVYEGNNAHSWYIDDIKIEQSGGVDDNDGNLISLYPNPAKESIRIEGLEDGSMVEFYNCLGELVKTSRINKEQEISINNLGAGFYWVRCGKATLRFVKM